MMNSLKERFIYYIWSSYRRRCLDELQQRYQHLYRGVVLDIGGRDRGAFKKPRHLVSRWINADINSDYAPDVVLDVAQMTQIATASIDVVNAIELFEHVDRIEAGLKECRRVLKPDGTMVLAVPFMFPVHADPYDFQRWTETRWRSALAGVGFQVEELVVMGRFFSVWVDMAKSFVRAMPGLIRKIMYLFYPLLDLMVLMDKTNFVLRNKELSGFHGGYFIICKIK